MEVGRANKEKPQAAHAGATLLPAAETTRKEAEVATAAEEKEKASGDMDVNAVFAKLKQIGGKGQDDDEE